MQKLIWVLLLALLSWAPAGSLLASDPVESEIVIREEEDRKIEEFWVDGKLEAIKVTPKVGKPYYLVDPDGRALDDQERGSLRLPSWKIFQW
ncbi:DUF2782 domain-containing protein [Marinospirillum sp.]|uniref:DUF2782 domain-containing protein n=1 Tax=Marinospirillum sp. TaxID=2183934 RepID=UPI00287017AE|nr:DUF2782 domain-containing protein [Marinospirillum sp.]MDR9468557.1 DUF2782 domain-containing protein [Marinospirillum sp.]